MVEKVKKLSVDEIMSKRADLQSSNTIVKAAKAPASWNKDQRSARFVMNSQTVDRYGDVVVTAGIDTTDFEKNPVALLFHMSRQWPVGSWGNLAKITNSRPPRIEGDCILLPSGGPIPEIDEAAWMIENGGIRACSIGFLPDWEDYEMILDAENQWTGGIQFNKSILLECSICAIPASPQALIKDAEHMGLARELIEDVIDNYAKTPAGLIVPRAEYEATHKDLGKNVSTFIFDKDFAIEPKEVDDVDLTKISTDAEAKTVIGAKVVFDLENPENKDDAHVAVIQKTEGTVIDSWIVPEGPKAGIHALAVEFISDAWSGMFRGIQADRFKLAGHEEQTSIPVESAIKKFVEAADAFAELIAKGDKISVSRGFDPDGEEYEESKFVIERDGKVVQELLVPNGMEAPKEIIKKFQQRALEGQKDKSMTIDLKVDTSGVEKATESVSVLEQKIERAEKSFDGLMVRISKFFGGGEETKEKDRIEPTLEIDKPEPTAEEIEVSRNKAADLRKRLLEKGMIAA